jgi:hypothetical protein
MKFENLLHEIILENIELGEGSALTQDEFLSRANKIHDDLRKLKGLSPYDYSKVNYVRNRTKVDVICHEKYPRGLHKGQEHGVFSVTPNSHINLKKPVGCPICGGTALKTKEEFIFDAHEIHDDLRKSKGLSPYDYSEVNYDGAKNKVRVVCHEKYPRGLHKGQEHGAFLITPDDHIKHRGCPICSGTALKTEEEFIFDAHEIHDKKRKSLGKKPYDYSEVKYVSTSDDVIIICHETNSKGEEHGPFLQRPSGHLKGQGCPTCQDLKGETNIKVILSDSNIKFTPQFQYEDCTSSKKTSKNKICKLLSFDFYLPDYNTLIEFDGVHHFKKHFKITNDNFMFGVINDREKNSFTKLKNIKLIRISYLDDKNLEEEIRNGLLSKEQLYLSKSYGNHKTGWVDDNFQPTTKFLKTYNDVD